MIRGHSINVTIYYFKTEHITLKKDAAGEGLYLLYLAILFNHMGAAICPLDPSCFLLLYLMQYKRISLQVSAEAAGVQVVNLS